VIVPCVVGVWCEVCRCVCGREVSVLCGREIGLPRLYLRGGRPPQADVVEGVLLDHERFVFAEALCLNYGSKLEICFGKSNTNEHKVSLTLYSRIPHFLWGKFSSQTPPPPRHHTLHIPSRLVHYEKHPIEEPKSNLYWSAGEPILVSSRTYIRLLLRVGIKTVDE